MSWAASERTTELLDLEDLGDDGMSAVTYESDTEKLKKKKSSHKPPKSPKSPYLSTTNLNHKKAPVWRSLKGTGFMHTENPMAKTPRHLWLASLKQGVGLTQPLKSEFDTGQAWVGSSSSTPEYLKEALGMKKPKYSRSASNGYIPGTPDYKEKEDMYDEIIELKKMLQVQKSEGDMMKTKLRRLEEENSKKDRQIEQLLDPSKSSEFSRSLVDKRNDASLVVNGLKQKILRLEQQCKEKDTMLNKLQTELKTTSLEEMKIAMETYYDEIQRLQMILEKAETTEKNPPSEVRTSQKQQKAFNTALLKLSKNIKELQEENQSLKVDLERALGSSPTSNRTKGYSDWSKQRLVRRITELEKKAGELESPKLQSSDLAKSANPTSVSQTQLNEETPPGSNVVEECERLRGLVKNLKGDRSSLQSTLADKDSEVKRLQQTRHDLERELRKLEEEKEKARKEIEQLTQKVKSLEKAQKEESQRKEQATQEFSNMKESPVPGAASPRSRPTSAKSVGSLLSRQRSARSDGGKEERRRQKAAETIQTNWRRYKAKKEIDDLDKVATALQAAFRGHLARQKLLFSSDPDIMKCSSLDNLLDQHPTVARRKSSSSLPTDTSPEEEAVTLLQSAFRAHLARMGQSEQSATVSSSFGARRGSTRNHIDQKFASSSPRQPSHRGFNSSPDNEDTDVSEDLIEEPVSDEEDDNKWRRPNELSLSSRQPSSGSLYHKKQPRFSPPLNEVTSDDSDDIIISPSRPMKRQDSNF